MTSSNGNIFCITGPLWGESTASVDYPKKWHWCAALMFSLIFVWTSDWANNPDAGDLRHHLADNDITVMLPLKFANLLAKVIKIETNQCVLYSFTLDNIIRIMLIFIALLWLGTCQFYWYFLANCARKYNLNIKAKQNHVHISWHATYCIFILWLHTRGRVTHICISKIGQQHYLNQCWFIVNWNHRDKVSENLINI